MATTFLQMVNRVLHGLREERIGAFTAGDSQQEGIRDLVNDAARSILERVQWPFDRRSDLVVDFDGRDYAGSDAGVTGVITNPTTVQIDAGTQARAVLLAAQMAATRRIYRLGLGAVTTDDAGTLLHAQGYPITVVEPDAITDDVVLTLRDPLMAEGGTPPFAGPITWDLFSYESILPETVRAVLELWNEERPIAVLYEDPAILRRVYPRPQDTRGDPTVAYVYGYGTSTSSTSGLVSGTAVTGTILTVFPVPDKVLRIAGSYLYRHPALELVGDVLENVPDAVNDLIVRMAIVLAMEGMEGNDPVRAASMRVQLFGSDRGGRDTFEGGEFGRIWREEQRRTPGQRHVMASFGKAGHVPSRQRWASQTVPSPT